MMSLSSDRFDVLRLTCKGPCWKGVWVVFKKRGFYEVGDYYTNGSGNVKRFRSEASARKVADQLNAGKQQAG